CASLRGLRNAALLRRPTPSKPTPGLLGAPPRALLALSGARSVLTPLLTIQFDNQLLVDRRRDIFALGQGQHAALEVLAVHFQPAYNRLVARVLARALDHRKLLGLVANLDLIARADLERRDVHPASVDVDVAMADDLPRLAPRCGKAQA